MKSDVLTRFSKFDLNLLRALDALLTERSVTRAADDLCVTQQAVSGSLRRLREHFDDPLLVRVGREMELTPLARGLVAPLHEALLNLQSALHIRPSFDPKLAARTFRIAISDYGSFVIMPRLLRMLAKEAPLITLEVTGLKNQSFLELEHGELDFFATTSPTDLYGIYRPGEHVRSQALFQDDFVCLADKAHPDLKGELTAELYRGLPHSLVRFGALAGTIVEHGWRQQGLVPKIASIAPGFATMIFMLPGTASIGTAQRKLATVLAGPLNLRVHECPVPIDRLEECLFWHDRNSQDPAHAFVRTAFQEVSLQLVDGHN